MLLSISCYQARQKKPVFLKLWGNLLGLHSRTGNDGMNNRQGTIGADIDEVITITLLNKITDYQVFTL